MNKSNMALGQTRGFGWPRGPCFFRATIQTRTQHPDLPSTVTGDKLFAEIPIHLLHIG